MYHIVKYFIFVIRVYYNNLPMTLYNAQTDRNVEVDNLLGTAYHNIKKAAFVLRLIIRFANNKSKQFMRTKGLPLPSFMES